MLTKKEKFCLYFGYAFGGLVAIFMCALFNNPIPGLVAYVLANITFAIIDWNRK